MTDGVPDFVAGLLSGVMRVVADAYCPTWKVMPLTGWRWFLWRWFYLPERWFKHERERVFYSFNGMIVCSPENSVLLADAIPANIGGEETK